MPWKFFTRRIFFHVSPLCFIVFHTGSHLRHTHTTSLSESITFLLPSLLLCHYHCKREHNRVHGSDHLGSNSSSTTSKFGHVTQPGACSIANWLTWPFRKLIFGKNTCFYSQCHAKKLRLFSYRQWEVLIQGMK